MSALADRAVLRLGFPLSLALAHAAWGADGGASGPRMFRLVERDPDAGSGARYFIRAGLPTERCAFVLVFGNPKADGGAPAPTTASVLRHRGVNCRPFLERLAPELGFRGALPAVEPAGQVNGTVTLLGEKQSRSAAATFSPTPPGPWTATRLSLGRDACALPLNIDVHDGVGEFAPTDERCTPGIVAELSKVLLPERGMPATAGDKAWDTLSRAEKREVMKTRVLPQMQAVFQELDATRYRKIDCTLCHGARARRGQFTMPNPDLPTLDFANHLRKERTEKFKITRFMFKHVAPETALALGVEPFDPTTNRGFGCQSCHLIKR